MEQPRDAQTQSSPPQHWQVQQQYQEPVQAQPLGQHSHDPDYLHEDNRLGIPGTHINPLPLAVGRYGDWVKRAVLYGKTDADCFIALITV